MVDPSVRIKVCGLTSVAEAVMCASAGADWIGLNFHPASPRRIDLVLAAEIIAALPPTAQAVGLFVDRPMAEIAQVTDHLGLRIVQLHGQEPAEALCELAGLQVVRAFRLGSREAVHQMTHYLRRAEELGRPPDAVLVDAFAPGQAGGTGRTIAADVLDALPPLPRLILAGGLVPENVGALIAHVRPWMVDVASGVESAPGRKDPARVAAFVRAAKARFEPVPFDP
ncbi:MAG: phosphoribosylanthranilate isomerase [Isosphaeraceae bacterium]|nr:phosphoribosylanthranilate isomerase [Isosphaeraceae bacterium]